MNETQKSFVRCGCWIGGKFGPINQSAPAIFKEISFGDFDSTVQSDDRLANKPERIGKKYQWLALHEATARIADNFHVRQDAYNGRSSYDGAWQESFRDVDPTCLIKSTPRKELYEMKPSWWSSIEYRNWESEAGHDTWLRKIEDLPPISHLLSVKNPKDDTVWLNLDGTFRWTQPVPSGEERYESPNKEIRLNLHGFIVQKSDCERLVKWSKNQDFHNHWMPGNRGETRVFLREYFWSSAFIYHYGGRPTSDWDNNYGSGRKIPAKVLLPFVKYMRERTTFDCSVDDTIYFYMPSKWICGQMRLTMREDGHFYSQNGKLVAFDPSIREAGTSCLLIRQDEFHAFLKNNGYSIFWTLLGERNLYHKIGHERKFYGGLVLNGGYALNEDGIEGWFASKFLSH